MTGPIRRLATSRGVLFGFGRGQHDDVHGISYARLGSSRKRIDGTLAFDISLFSANTSWNPVLIRLETQAVRAGDVIECDWDVPDIADIGTWTLRFRILPGEAAAQAPFSSSAASANSAGRGL